MPTYEYECDHCHHRFDELQSFKDEPLKVCPKCHEERLRRLFGTGAAILFKGSGFYETDYRSESYKKAAKAEQESTGKSSDSNGKSESNGSTASTPTESKKSETKPSSSST
jgi:putative FmdB family regulatory protein